MSAESIYVEISIDGDVDDLWRLTQDPDEHARWDLRFTDIEYLPRPDPDAAQEFTYRTRIGGLSVEGTGESVGDREEDGERTSALVFRSDDPKALIREGNGFWRYIPTEDGIRFLTEYDYETRHGRAGRLFDRVVFRPLIGWATAWSFDRLRMWLEDGVEPGLAMRNAAIHAVARTTLAFVWLYQGLVPKLLVGHPEELALIRASGWIGSPQTTLLLIGLVEITLGFLLLWRWRTRWLLLLAGTAPPVLTVVAGLAVPSSLVGPFNPVVLGIAMFALGMVGYIAGRDLPTAANCLRSPPEGEA